MANVELLFSFDLFRDHLGAKQRHLKVSDLVKGFEDLHCSAENKA